VAVDGRGCWTSGQPKLNNPSCRGCGCRKRESECSKPPLSAAAPASERARERARRSAAHAQQHPRTAHTTAHSTKARAAGGSGHLLTGARSWPRALHACCNPVTPTPTVICIVHSSEPSPLLRLCQAESMSDVRLNQTLCKLSPLPLR
jgi:hypothetical protein